MATPGRKKSIASSSGLPQLQIDNPVASNTILNKAASTSIYQQCVLLKSRLLKIHDFAPYLALVDDPDRDVVHTLWECLALGTPLCFLFNLLDLPQQDRLQVSTDPDEIVSGPDSLRERKKAAAFFIMGVQRLRKAGQWADDVELFTVTELTNLESKDTNGFVKVVATVTHLLDRLPPHVWKEDPPDSPSYLAQGNSDALDRSEDSPTSAKPGSAQEVDRNNIIRELLETERKYVQDLEVMQNYARTLMQQDIVDQDTIHHLFPGLNKLLDFQRKFLIELEQQMEVPWEQQRWGRCFSSNEANFVVYEPYCANYTNASELVLVEEPHLMAVAHLIHPKSELPAFLIKPVQRICKYPLLLESLVKRCPQDHEFYQELVEGAASSKRVTDKVNEAQRRAENAATVKLLETRVEDWKGHALSNFGELLLDDVFMVTKSDVDREYHVFLFEKIILCCKDATAVPSKKVGKSNSILKKTPSTVPTPSLLAGGAAAAKKKTTPLLLKGRIFLNNVTQAVPNSKIPGQYLLQVWWRGDDDLEYFTLRCRTEEQMKQWEAVIMRLIKDLQLKRGERTSHIGGNMHEKASSVSSSTNSVTSLPPYPGPPLNGQRGRYTSYADEKPPIPYGAGYNNHSPSGYYPGGTNDWDPEDDTDDSYASSGGLGYSSGRGTPVGAANGRRGAAAMSMPPERDPAPGYDRPRAKTGDPSLTEWKAHPYNGGMGSQSMQQLPGAGFPPRPVASRNASATSGASVVSDASFGNGVPNRMPTLRSQFSKSRLNGQYDEGGGERGSGYSRYDQNPNPPVPMNRPPPTNPNLGQPLSRSRSISNPTQMHNPPKQPAPPMPIAPQWTGSSQSSGGRMAAGNAPRAPGRGYAPPGRRPNSGHSSDTAESSEHSPEAPQAEAQPVLRGTRSQVFNGRSNGQQQHYQHQSHYDHTTPNPAHGPPVKIKVHWGEDLFMIVVPRTTSFEGLVDRVQRKIRLCGGNIDVPLRLKYDDEDGDRISLSTDEELQMAFDMTLSRSTGQGQLTLRVQ